MASSGPPDLMVASTWVMTDMMDLFWVKENMPGYFYNMSVALVTANKQTKQMTNDFILF
jgi:hypothetical protein